MFHRTVYLCPMKVLYPTCDSQKNDTISIFLRYTNHIFKLIFRRVVKFRKIKNNFRNTVDYYIHLI